MLVLKSLAEMSLELQEYYLMYIEYWNPSQGLIHLYYEILDFIFTTFNE